MGEGKEEPSSSATVDKIVTLPGSDGDATGRGKAVVSPPSDLDPLVAAGLSLWHLWLVVLSAHLCLIPIAESAGSQLLRSSLKYCSVLQKSLVLIEKPHLRIRRWKKTVCRKGRVH